MAEITKDMDLEKVVTEVTNRVYEASLVFERLEGLGMVHGNGHHMAQKVSKFAEELVRKRWRENTAE